MGCFYVCGKEPACSIFSKTAGRAALLLGIAVFERRKSYAMASGVLGTLVGVVIIQKFT